MHLDTCGTPHEDSIQTVTETSVQTNLLGSLLLLLLYLMILITAPGCQIMANVTAPNDQLSFPSAPVKVDDAGRWYDVDGDGRIDFAFLYGDNGLLDVLQYDDDQDGVFDRIYKISDYDPEQLPHLIVLMDSIPYRLVKERYDAGDWHWFYTPQKTISPFPSMSVVIFSEILKTPPLNGSIERYYDNRTGRIENLMIKRAFGYEHPWHRRLTFYLHDYWKVGMTYFKPQPWFVKELVQTKAALDGSPHRVTISYVSASSGLASREGRDGIQFALDHLEQFCVQLLYERRGAVRISIISDHGHNLSLSENVPVKDWLKEAGFHPKNRIDNPQLDVVPEIDGMVTYFGVSTRYPQAVADALLKHPEVELAVYMKGESVIIDDGEQQAAIDNRSGRYRYRPIRGDVLGYAPIVKRLISTGEADADGFATPDAWLNATADYEWPDIPYRVWDALHGRIVNPPIVMFTLHDGYCAGLGLIDHMITMQSTHGGLNQINSDAMILTMTQGVKGPMRSSDVMDAIEPRYDPAILPDRPIK